MGEFAMRIADGEQIKIGTCEDLYYLRYEDKGRVDYGDGWEGMRFRLPYPDEDGVAIGDYNDSDRSYPLLGCVMPDLEPREYVKRDGSRDKATCTHAELHLYMVKLHKGKVYPIVRCKECEGLWRTDWEDVVAFVRDGELLRRLSTHFSEKLGDEPMNENDRFAALKAAIEELTGETMPPGIERTLRSYESPDAGTMASVLSATFPDVPFNDWDDLCASHAYFTPPAATDKTTDVWYGELLDALSLRGAPGVCEFSDILVDNPNNDALADAFDRLEREVPDWESRTQQSVVLTPGRSGRLVSVWEAETVAPPVDVAPAPDKARKTRQKRGGNDDALAAIMARLDAVESENAALKKRLESGGSPETPKRNPADKLIRALWVAAKAENYLGFLLRGREAWVTVSLESVKADCADMPDDEIEAMTDQKRENAIGLARKCMAQNIPIADKKYQYWVQENVAA